MSNFKVGDRVNWVKKMACVPHPEGKTDKKGNVLSVFRDTLMEGRIIRWSGADTLVIRPNGADAHKDRICGERYYDFKIKEENITLAQ